MTTSEKNLAVWNKATEQPAPDKAANMFLRSIEVEPVHLGGNRWETPSTTRRGVTYQQEVFFAGMNPGAMLGYELHIDCGCPAANGQCKHRAAIQSKYNSNWALFYHLFGLPTTARMSELHEKARETDARIQANQNIRRAA